MFLALRKCKNDCKILKIILVQIFVHISSTFPLQKMTPVSARDISSYPIFVPRVFLLEPCERSSVYTYP